MYNHHISVANYNMIVHYYIFQILHPKIVIFPKSEKNNYVVNTFKVLFQSQQLKTSKLKDIYLQ